MEAQASAQGLDVFDVVTRMGTRIVPVEDLERPVIYLLEYDIALVRSGMCHDDRVRAADYVMCVAVGRAGSPSRM